jgi:hypothetical protein
LIRSEVSQCLKFNDTSTNRLVIGNYTLDHSDIAARA